MLSVVSHLTVGVMEMSSSEVTMSKHRPDFRAECLWHEKGEGSQNNSEGAIPHWTCVTLQL